MFHLGWLTFFPAKFKIAPSIVEVSLEVAENSIVMVEVSPSIVDIFLLKIEFELLIVKVSKRWLKLHK